MSVAISWANKMQLAKCDIRVGFCKSSHILNSAHITIIIIIGIVHHVMIIMYIHFSPLTTVAGSLQGLC